MATPIVTTVVRNNFRTFVAGLASSVLTWLLASKWGGVHFSTIWAMLTTGAGAGVYATVINWVAKKVPFLNYLLGNQPTPPATPTPPPAPTPVPPVVPPVVVASGTAPKK